MVLERNCKGVSSVAWVHITWLLARILPTWTLAQVKHGRTQKLPLLAPNNMVSGIVLEVGDIVRCPVEVVYDDF